MLNRTTFAALSFASISLLSLAARADESATAPLAAAAAQPAPAPTVERAQASDDEEAPAPDTSATVAAAPAPAPTYAPAYAPPVYTPAAEAVRPFPDRSGFTIGFALGAGSLKIGDEKINPDTSVGLSFRLGGAITPSFLIQADLEATRADFGQSGALQLNFFGVSATGYVHPRVYLVGGLGAASLAAVDGNNQQTNRSDDALGVLLGVGVEAYQSSGFGLSIELRGIAASFNDTTVSGGNILLGFQWF